MAEAAKSNFPVGSDDSMVGRVGLASTGRLRVMQVVLSLAPGGTERLVIDVVKRLKRTVDTVVCCLDEPGAWAGELTERGVPVWPIGRAPGFHPSLGRRLAAVAAQHRADVLHCHQYSPFVYSRIAKLFRPTLKIVFTEHGRLSDATPSLKRRVVNPVLGRLPATIYAVSEDLRQHMIRSGFPANRVGVVHNGIEPGLQTTTALRAKARQTLGIPGDVFVVGTAARLDPVKELDPLFEATALLKERLGRVRLVVIGDGPERAKLEERARQTRLGGTLEFTGHRPDLRTLLPALDVYANTSVSEGISLTILEAMAASLPVVATTVGGTPEVVLPGETGMLVPPREPARVADAIQLLYQDPARRTSMGRSGRSRVERHFSLDRMVQSYFDAYRSAMN